MTRRRVQLLGSVAVAVALAVGVWLWLRPDPDADALHAEAARVTLGMTIAEVDHVMGREAERWYTRNVSIEEVKPLWTKEWSRGHQVSYVLFDENERVTDMGFFERDHSLLTSIRDWLRL